MLGGAPPLIPVRNITENVLGTGTHCGDVFDLGQIDALEQEVHLLTSVLAPCSPDMATFLSQLHDLVAAARAEQNPTYFG
jgi:hypothetical protein